LTWDVCGEVSETFTKLSHCPTEVSDDDLQKLDKFVVLTYDRSSAVTGVDEARLDLFARKQRSYDAIPPISAALKEHAKRAAYHAGIIWALATIPNLEISSPTDWGWSHLSGWRVMADLLDNTSSSCNELSGADQVCLQERLQPQMQMLPLRTLLYCTLHMRV